MNRVTAYFRELSGHVGQSWSRFWFTPSDPLSVCAMRLLTGAMAFYLILSYTADLTRWFGPHGLVTVSTVARLSGAGNPNQSIWRESIFYYIDQPAALWAVHVIALLAAGMCAVGLLTRITTPLTLVLVLSYVHRAPLITGQFEPLLTMMLLYLCIAPAGRYLSVDSWLRRKQGNSPREGLSTAATISLRLIQVHAAMFYLMMGLTKLAGEPWWNGEAVWWLMAQSESRLVDFTFIAERRAWLIFNLWTYAIIAYELSFAVLIWNGWARPLLLIAGVVMWLALIPLTGLTSYALMMLVVNAAFVPLEWWRALWPHSAGEFVTTNSIEKRREAVSAAH